MDNYHCLKIRLDSYKDWPTSFISPERLAAAGFYYTGEDDHVKCYECGIEIFDWDEGDDPISDHQRWRPACRFLRQNISTDNNPHLTASTNLVGETRQPDCLSAQLEKLVIPKPKTLAHPEYGSYEARLETFDNWPTSVTQTKEELADAGFYYTGQGDHTPCYFCGGGLKDWEPEDIPWVEHAKWFSRCYSLRIIKGDTFVKKVINKTE
uniref:Uncharacterized protein n=1 Tax=Bracon brevicornis TaxID=1563983 RepID=A0A6V7KQN5_9HYME